MALLSVTSEYECSNVQLVERCFILTRIRPSQVSCPIYCHFSTYLNLQLYNENTPHKQGMQT